MRLALLAIILLAGCTLCESPYIKVDGDCCLDEDEDDICDEPDLLQSDNSDVAQSDETAETKTDEAKVDNPEIANFRYALENVKLTKEVYKPDFQVQLPFYVSTQQLNELKGAVLSMQPMCESGHDVHVLLNDEIYSTIGVTCGELVTFDIPKGDIDPGENVIEFVTETKPYLVENTTITIRMAEDQVLEFKKFVLETTKRDRTIANVKRVVLQNYYELEFDIEDEVVGDVALSLDKTEKKDIQIFLNGNLIYDGAASKVKTLVLPEKHLKPGKNVVRYMANP